ncbi:MAG: GNAT family N-acetyltransferase [Chloroflexota bacterium]
MTVPPSSDTAPRLRTARTSELSARDIAAARAILWAAFPEGEEGFTEDDWQHGLGGMHFLLEVRGELVAHGSVVEREIHIARRPLRAGYMESVGVMPSLQGRGYGSLVAAAATAYIREGFEVGVLGTGRHSFYERLGWRTWRGPSSVRTSSGEERTPDEDGYILVLETPSSPPLDSSAPISCDWRPGDVW